MRMQHITITLLLLTGLIIGACNKQTPGLNTYDMPFSDRITFDKDKRLIFSDLLEDNRCPMGVQCIVPGQAIVEFTGICNADTVRFALHNGVEVSGARDTMIFDEYRIELLQVLPLPVVGIEVEEEDYECRVLVEKLP